MSEKFNPLKTWLGVTAPKPSYYQLIGLDNFEVETPVIAAAADRAIARVQIHSGGGHREVAEKLVRDLTTVKNVLLSSDKRRAYDDQLRRQLGGAAPPAAAAKAPVTLPQSLEAADSPTMMLPRGALPPLGSPPPGFGAVPTGFPPAAALPPSAMPMGGHPPGHFGAPPPGMGIPPAGLPPQAYPPGMLPPGAMPQHAAPFGQLPPGAMPPPGPGMPPPGFAQPPFAAMHQPDPGIPAYQFGPPPGPAAAPAGFGPGPANPFADVAPRQASPSVGVRASGRRKQSQSTLLVAILVLGGAAGVLAVVMFIANKKQSETAVNPSPPLVIENVAPVRQSTPPAAPPTPTPEKAGSEAFAQALGNAFSPGMNGDLRTPPTGDGPSPASPAMTTTVPEPVMAEPAPGSAPVLKGVNVEPANMVASLPEDAARAKSVPTMLSAARTALKSRDYGKAEEIILQAQVTADSPALVQLALDHARVADLIGSFWTSVRDGVKSLKEGDEITVNGKPAAVVRQDDVNLVVKQDNKEIALVIDKLAPATAVALAERSLPKTSGAGKLVVGVFLAIDQAGDATRGLNLITEASLEGTDVGELRTLLGGK